VNDQNIPFLISSLGLVVMLLWAGYYKMTAPGAEGIIPLVSNSPLISWHFKLFGSYFGSDLSQGVRPSGSPAVVRPPIFGFVCCPDISSASKL
jgi:uncharacterized membrane protein YkgB